MWCEDKALKDWLLELFLLAIDNDTFTAIVTLLLVIGILLCACHEIFKVHLFLYGL